MQQHRTHRLLKNALQSGLYGLLLLSAAQMSFAQSDAGYRVLREIRVGGGKGGWDYIAVNSELKRIYLSHDTLVNILDETTGDSVGIIPNTVGVHGIAFATPFGKGYTSNGRANAVTAFDLKTNQVLRQVSTGKNPDAIIYEPFSKTIMTCNGRSQDASFIDPSSDSVVHTIALGGRPETPASDAAGNIYVNIEDKNEIVHINAKTFSVEHRWSIGKGDSPAGLAIDRATKRLFIGCANKLMVVMNAENGKVLAELPIGDRCDGTAFDAGAGYAFASNGDGTLTMVKEVSADSFSVVANVPTKRGARTISVDEQTHHVFLPTAQFGEAPPPTAERPHPRPPIIAGTFEVLEVGNK